MYNYFNRFLCLNTKEIGNGLTTGKMSAAAVIAIFMLQTITTNIRNTSDSLTENMGETSLAKSKAFADIIAADPAIITSKARLWPAPL